MNFFAAQKREQHFRITDIIDITGENIAVENNEIGVFSEAQGAGIPGAPGGFGSKGRIALGVVSSLLLCFITSFDEFVIAFFLTGTENTLPVYLFSRLRFPNKLPGTLALGSAILAGSALLVVAAELLRKLGVQSANPGDL